VRAAAVKHGVLVVAAAALARGRLEAPDVRGCARLMPLALTNVLAANAPLGDDDCATRCCRQGLRANQSRCVLRNCAEQQLPVLFLMRNHEMRRDVKQMPRRRK
jgi:hypothetical protein